MTKRKKHDGLTVEDRIFTGIAIILVAFLLGTIVSCPIALYIAISRLP